MHLVELVAPAGWRLSTLGLCSQLDNNLREPISASDRKSMKGPYRYYGPTGVVDHIDHYQVNGEYALIAEDGDHFLKFEKVDMTQLVSGKFNVNNHAHLVKGLNDCTTHWIYNFYRRANLYPFITRQGAGRYKLNKGTLEQLPILVPPLAEQRKIAEILGMWDEAIATVEQLIDALKRRKQGLMQRLLTGQIRFPEFAGEAWREVQLGDIVEPISREEDVLDEKEYRLIGVRWYLEGAHIHDVVLGENITIRKLNRIEKNDIVYNKMWVSKAAFSIAKAEHEGAYGTNEYPQFRVKDGLDVQFLEYAFHNPRFLYDAKSLCRGTTGRIRLHPRDFLQLPIRIPPLDEQKKIATLLACSDQEIEMVQKKLMKLKDQKKGLMQRLLTGQVRVQVDEG